VCAEVLTVFSLRLELSGIGNTFYNGMRVSNVIAPQRQNNAQTASAASFILTGSVTTRYEVSETPLIWRNLTFRTLLAA
jgi:hypothetical protein